jgi:NTP pyrophosphatase (non-canonical NTP hydrolase)
MLRDRGTLVHASFEEVASLSAAIDDQIKLARQANLTVLMYRATEIATAHGFTENTPGEDIALMHSELSEALEDFRNGKGLTETWYEPKQPLPKPCGIPTEMADELIRVLHFCGKHGIDIEKAVIEKMAFNDSRPYKHGGKKI